jgi:hypothetical protein
VLGPESSVAYLFVPLRAEPSLAFAIGSWGAALAY